MILHECHVFYQACSELSDAAEWLERVDPSTRLLDDDDANYVTFAIRRADLVLEKLGINDGGFYLLVRNTLDHVLSLREGIWKGVFEVRADVLAHDYRQIREGILQEILKHKFLYLPAPGDKNFSQEKLFGDLVYEAFPSARYDIKEAGNALAFEMFTACAFHLMRAAELALRALANDRDVVLTTKKGGTPYPLDMGTWEQVLSGFTDSLEAVAQWDRSLGTIKVQALNFYTSAIQEFRAIKEWRNDIMHTRREYLSEDAAQIMVHVKRLMVTLSSRISETERTPKVWTADQLR